MSKNANKSEMDFEYLHHQML